MKKYDEESEAIKFPSSVTISNIGVFGCYNSVFSNAIANNYGFYLTLAIVTCQVGLAVAFVVVKGTSLAVPAKLALGTQTANPTIKPNPPIKEYRNNDLNSTNTQSYDMNSFSTYSNEEITL